MKARVAKQRASAILVVLAILGILSLYVLVNARTLSRLKHDVKQIEIRQIQRLTSTAMPAPTAIIDTNLPAIGGSNPFTAVPR